MLDRLPAPQRDSLSPLLHEIGGLGLAADSDLHQHLRDEENRQLAAVMAKGDAIAEAALRRLDAHAPPVVAQVLADESDVTVAALAARFPWRWSTPVLQRLRPQRRARVARLLPIAQTMQDTPWRLMVRAVCNRADLAAEAFEGAARTGVRSTEDAR